MANKTITIVTGLSPNLGAGHFQRMLNFLWYLKENSNIHAFLKLMGDTEYIPEELRRFSIPEIHPDSDLIIRDMRDSEQDEIDKLKRTGKVLVIDDLGEGRYRADYTIDLLPNLVHYQKNTNSFKDMFLFGYNFSKAVKSFSGMNIKKNIDLIIYPGFKIHEEYLKKLLSIFPENISILILSDNRDSSIKGRYPDFYSEKTSAELLLSGKIVITHFGITLYESYICGCRPMAINPTVYHSELTEMVIDTMNISNLGLYDDFDEERVLNSVENILQTCSFPEINPDLVSSKIDEGLNNFYRFIIDL